MRLTKAIILLLAFSCTEEKTFKPAFSVPSELRPYVDRFVYEAGLRGRVVSVQNLIIRFDASLDPVYCGVCNSTTLDKEIQKVIQIRSSSCWGNESELEALIFHELGHCLLGREHTSATLPNGAPKSIMIANDNSMYGPCIYQIGDEDECDKSYRRTYYVDELFDPAAPTPVWGN